jgi:hypothetical protein
MRRCIGQRLGASHRDHICAALSNRLGPSVSPTQVEQLLTGSKNDPRLARGRG